MQIKIATASMEGGCFRSTVTGTVEHAFLVCNFMVCRKGSGIVVDFMERPQANSMLFNLQQEARSLIVKEYLRLYALKQSFIRPDAASWNLLSICVDGCADADLYGRVYTLFAENPFLFQGMPSLLLQMDQFYEEINFPQAAMEYRCFRDHEEHPSGKIKKGVDNLSQYDLFCKKGEQGTFIIKVLYRQNASWQGTVTWVEGNKKQYFRSALELIRLIDSVATEDRVKFSLDEIVDYTHEPV